MAQKVEFEVWMRDVDASVKAKIGMSVHDLPDACFRDWYDDGMKPGAAASKAIKSAKEW